MFVCVYGFKIVDHQGFGITTKQPTINTSSEDPCQIMTMRRPSPPGPVPKPRCPQVLLICGLQSQPAGCPKEDRHFADAYHQSSSPSTAYRERPEGKRGRKQVTLMKGNGNLGRGFKYFLFSPLLGEDSHFDYYFSRGLKPPASNVFGSFFFEERILIPMTDPWDERYIYLHDNG